ncbi:MAG: hypothetical protein KJ077_38500 [Anaerolineae bacterium]|nr:hypothetical protein [Anaerolineae bacterium]
MPNLIEELHSSKYSGLFESIRTHVNDGVWAMAIHRHFTNHGPETAEQLLNILSSFVQRYPSELNEIERFLLAAAALLYDIGMQASNLASLGVSDDHLSEWQKLELIRQNRARLSAEMIRYSNFHLPDYPSLGLTEDFLSPLAEICSIQDRSLLHTIEENTVVLGKQVKLRELANLLLLADQLFISHYRVNIAILNEFEEISVDQRIDWWLHHYVEAVWIDDIGDNIKVRFEIPEEHADLTEAICHRIIKGPCAQVYDGLWKIGIRTRLTERPRNPLLPIGARRKQLLPAPLQEYLKTSSKPSFRGCTLYIDYESVHVFLGRHGQFELSTAEIIKRLIAASHTFGPVTAAFFYADWERYHEEAAVLNSLRSQSAYRILELVFHLDEQHGAIATHITEDALRMAHQSGRNQSFILACSQPGLEDNIQTLQQYGTVIIWATDRKTEQDYGRVIPAASIDNLLGLTLRDRIAEQVEETMLQTIAIIVDNDLVTRKVETLGFSQIAHLLANYPVFRWNHWWANLAIYRGILRRSATKFAEVIPYKLNNENLLVQDALELRAQVLETLETLTEQNAAITSSQLEKALKTNTAFSSDYGRQLWLTVLRDQKLIEEEPVINSVGEDIRVKVNHYHPIWLQVVGRQHLDRLIIAIDDLLLKSNYDWLQPTWVKRQLEARMARKVIQSIFNLADREGMIKFEHVQGKSGSYTRMYLIQRHQRVTEYLSYRDSVIRVSHDWLRLEANITRSKLESLLQTIGFGNSQAFRLKWIQMLVDEGILISTENTKELYRLDETNTAVQRALAPHYLNSLLFNVKCYQPKDYPMPGAKWSVNNLAHLTKSEDIAQATLDFCLQERFLRTKQMPNPKVPGKTMTGLDLGDKAETWQKGVDEQKKSVIKRLIPILEGQGKSWFSTSLLLDLMRPYEEFGVLDAERLFWIQYMVDEKVLGVQRRGSGPAKVYTLEVFK